MSRREVEWPDCKCLCCGRRDPAKYICVDLQGNVRGTLQPPNDRWQSFTLNVRREMPSPFNREKELVMASVQFFVCAECIEMMGVPIYQGD